MIVFVSNFFNHHQYQVSKELYRITYGKYRFIELQKIPNEFIKAGYPDYSFEPFLIKAWQSKKQLLETITLINNADVVIYGGYACHKFVKKRILNNKLTLEYGERIFKRGILNIFSTKFLKSLYFYYITRKKTNFYKLCAGAFVKNDMDKLGLFKNRCLRYGYFPVIKNTINDKSKKFLEEKVRIISVARLINWKRIDLGIKMAKKLKEKGYDFTYKIYGSGKLKNKLEKLILKYELSNYVKLAGNLPYEEIQQKMAEADIFVFTSNQREGWGAVLNEAMYNKCAIVAADKIGAVPFLINNKNGLTFKCGNVRDLTNKVEFLIQNPYVAEQFIENAYQYINEFWNPNAVASSLYNTLQELLYEKKISTIEGPCSLIN